LLQLLASQVLNPRSIDVSLDDIGGLEQVKEDMVSGGRGKRLFAHVARQLQLHNRTL
jgi:hypothetical protein